ncbi:MAG: HAD family hydrolase [Thermoplasmata archaeon]|nr:HAD family hydrolase [Thermoplasmata archaeon]
MTHREVEPRYVEPIMGLVFDLDGTLVLSRHDFPRMRREVIRAAERHGVTPGRLSVRDNIPRLMEEAAGEIQRANLPEGFLFKFQAEADQALDAIEMEALPTTVARPGAKELLAVLTEKGYRLAVLTRSSERFARSALQQTGLAGFFPYLRARGASGPVKPSPDSLLLLLKEMGVPKDRALFVGDHLLDVECGLRASVLMYGLLPQEATPDGMTAERFLAAGAAAVATDLPDLGRKLGLPKSPQPTPAR